MMLDYFKTTFSFATLILTACTETTPNTDAKLMYRDGKSIDINAEGARSVVRLALQNPDGSETFNCSGVLVDTNVILTAAHCVFYLNILNGTIGDRIDPSTIQIQLSNGLLTTGKHAEYPKNLGFAYSHVDALDVAFIVLEQPAPERLIAGVATYDEFNAWRNEFGVRAKGISFGKTADSMYSAGSLNSVDLSFMGFFGPRKDLETLEIKPANTPDRQARPLEFMAGFDTVNACFGDSGGGLFISVGGKLKLAGITSRTLVAPGPWSENCAVGTLSTVYGFAEAALRWAKRSAPEAFSNIVPP